MASQDILLVEDDHDIRSSIADFLTLEGYGVAQARNGQDALDQLETLPLPCLILLDLMMPVMSGQDFLFAKKADARFADVPVVVVSAVADKSKVPQELVRGFVKKPIDLDVLLGFVEAYCQG